MRELSYGWTPSHLSDRRDSSGAERVVENGRDFDPGITIPNRGWNAPLTDLVTHVAFVTNSTQGNSATARLYDTVLKLPDH